MMIDVKQTKKNQINGNDVDLFLQCVFISTGFISNLTSHLFLLLFGLAFS